MVKYIISDSDIISNYNLVKEKTNALVIPVLKANAYGMGAKHVFEILKNEGVKTFMVSRIEEALSLKDDKSNIIILSCYNSPDYAKKIIENDFVCGVDSFEFAKMLNNEAKRKEKKVKIHIKIETGFGRFGFTDLNEIIKIKDLENIEVEGIFSHFYGSFLKNDKFTDKQFEKFLNAVDFLIQNGFNFKIRHIANSCAILKSRKYDLDAVRCGSLLCGRSVINAKGLKKVGYLLSDICDIRWLEKGSNIGYGNVFKLKRKTKVGVLNLGSYDGLLMKKDYDTFRFIDILRYGFGVFKMLLKDNKTYFKVGDKKCAVLGRVALNHTMIDLTDVDCKIGDTAKICLSPLTVSESVEREYHV